MQKDEVCDKLRQKILKEELTPGQWLVERDICDEYSISRTPVREILHKLASEGLVSIEPSKGCYVRKLTIEDIIEVFQAREAIEGIAAKLSCIRFEEAFLHNIDKLKSQIKSLDIDSDASKGVEKGRELHDLIITTANNSVITGFYNNLKNQNVLIRNLTKKSLNIEKQSQEAHLEITQAILDNDPEKSEQAMRKHLRDTCKILVNKILGI
ncbi:MAG: GntR family transcriptional regulator [Proteobacteria bacterium]|nr:GntR family transcriptional regulator [Pseudomonadota bacterium]